ncbi:dual specificity protein phosphatase 12 [Nannizzia gypsea CBS 118893]|uniref:protein-tyrosine-phosphatase n=1 Tax=Arthroderma gypseum (strain ATCC MYA-4604 / CBS 118893) TaxID=535722 RepID=E5R348_ARTGP|nr:dual specificity protein phosphatase 12 [Nannizzia gypsea CBS 118893]EFQ98752.1 dual specificity protein phosphatase 12 [Nannizzia gypsea CBS 118893]
MALNRVGDDNLYIGGLMALNNKLAIERENITHTVTVLRINVDEERFKPFKEHLHIPVDDVEDEDLLQHFPTTNAFIRSGLESGTGGVLVHCAMGKSRSATVCIAYLLRKDPGALTPREALDLIRCSRPLCEPNDGFMEQLELYHKMGCPDNVVDHPVYQRWLYQRAVQDSVACGKGPEPDEIHFEDQGIKSNSDNGIKDPVGRMEIKCRKCRRQLATLPFIIQHTPGNKGVASQAQAITPISSPTPTSLPPSTCAHIFLHPLTWMRPSLFPSSPEPKSPNSPLDPNTNPPLSGRLTCPSKSCGANIGKFAWAGMPCSCGTWVVPAIALARARVDVLDANMTKGSAAGGVGVGIRMPPGMIRAPVADARAEMGDDESGKGLL